MKAVAGKTIEWKDTVTLGTEDAPEKTAALYAPDAVFWGTVSEQVRNTPEQVYDYFVSYRRERSWWSVWKLQACDVDACGLVWPFVATIFV